MSVRQNKPLGASRKLARKTPERSNIPRTVSPPPFILTWTEPTLPDETHPDDWVDLLPARATPLPSIGRLFRMSKAERAKVIQARLLNCIVEIEGLRSGMFRTPAGTCPHARIRNARRRCRRLFDRGQMFGLWKKGRWQLGGSTAWMQ